MNIDLSDEALEFGVTVRKALESAGGDQLVQMAESEPDRRESIVAPVLGELGAWSTRPRAGGDELEAAAALCRSAGYWSVAYPVAERLCRPGGLEADGLVVVADAAPAAAIAGIDLRWAAVAMSGRRSTVAAVGPAAPPRQSAFVVELDLEPVDDEGVQDLPLALVLPCWTLLGVLDRAMDLTRDYVLEREQFGQPLAAFQGVQFQLTDAEVERAGAGGAGQVRPLEHRVRAAGFTRQRIGSAVGRHRGSRHRLPDRPPAARGHWILRRDRPVLGVPIQHAAAPAAVRSLRHARSAQPASRPARARRNLHRGLPGVKFELQALR